jgi:hypothetical protein
LGYLIYLVHIVIEKTKKRIVSRMRKKAATGRSACEIAGYGRLRMRVAGIPVPMVTLRRGGVRRGGRQSRLNEWVVDEVRGGYCT